MWMKISVIRVEVTVYLLSVENSRAVIIQLLATMNSLPFYYCLKMESSKGERLKININLYHLSTAPP